MLEVLMLIVSLGILSSFTGAGVYTSTFFVDTNALSQKETERTLLKKHAIIQGSLLIPMIGFLIMLVIGFITLSEQQILFDVQDYVLDDRSGSMPFILEISSLTLPIYIFVALFAIRYIMDTLTLYVSQLTRGSNHAFLYVAKWVPITFIVLTLLFAVMFLGFVLYSITLITLPEGSGTKIMVTLTALYCLAFWIANDALIYRGLQHVNEETGTT